MKHIHPSSLKAVWALTKPYWVSAERWIALALLAVIIALNLGEVYLNVLFNDWNNDFYNSFQTVNKTAFAQALIRFSCLATIFIIVAVYKTYLNQMLRIKWRKWMTTDYLANWLGKQNYYRMQLFGGKLDNPDQRISDDIEQFIALTLGLSLGLLSAVVTLFSFLHILWKLSGDLSFTIGTTPITIPGYMVWVAIVYAIIGTWITFKIGQPLRRLNFEQQHFEANFRFSLVRLRENTESIAFYKGEPQESAIFHTRFGQVVDNFWQIMKRQKMLNWFTSGYGQIAVIFPFVVAAPRFFAKQIQLGGLMQTASAFGHVQGALSFIIDSFTSIATWEAVIERLSGFTHSIELAEAHATPPAGFLHTTIPDKIINAQNLTLKLPNGKILLSDLNLTLKPGDSLLITGASGVGKSTVLRALSGLWPFVEGSLSVPEHATMLFLPQKPYLPLGSLASVLSYPSATPANDDDLCAMLQLCKLEKLVDALHHTENWSHMLSLGEQQRIAFARILLTKPDFVFMDEATSAVDEALEVHLYNLLKEKLPNTAIVSVGHRSTLKQWHKNELHLGA